MGTRVYNISGGNAASSGNQNFLNDANRLPVVASQVGNDSLVAGSNVALALNALLAAIPTSSTNILNFSDVDGATVTDALNALLLGNSAPYIQKPAVPDAFDQEFEDGNADWAALGWTVINAVTGVVQTRSGDINPWTNPAAGTYFSTCIGSWIFTQAPAGIQLDIYKNITLAAGETYFARTVGTYYLASGAANRFNEVGFYGASGALLDNNNRAYNTVRDEPTAAYLAIDSGRFTAGAFAGTTGRQALGGHDIRGMYFVSGTTHRALLVDSQNGEPHTFEITGAPAAGTLTRFGMRNVFSNTTGTVPQIWACDFVRKKTGNAWLIP